MAFMSSGVVRVILSTALASLIGAIYFNPQINPAAEVWMNKTYPNIADPRRVEKPLVPIFGSMTCYLVASALMNRYVNMKQLPITRLIGMAFELWALTFSFQFPHVLFSKYDIVLFLIEQVNNFLVILTMSLTLGYKRYPPVVTQEEMVIHKSKMHLE